MYTTRRHSGVYDECKWQQEGKPLAPWTEYMDNSLKDFYGWTRIT